MGAPRPQSSRNSRSVAKPSRREYRDSGERMREGRSSRAVCAEGGKLVLMKDLLSADADVFMVAR